MIQTEIKKLDQALNDAISVAKRKGIPQLISVTESIDNDIDPFLFFEKAKEIEGGRIFWSSAAGDFCLAGAGEALLLQSDRSWFEEIEKQWKEMLENTIIYNSFQVPGTGPVALGGFSFDPEKKTTPLWGNFKGSQFRVPAYLFTKIKSRCYITINAIVCEQDHPKQLGFQLERRVNYLLEKQVNMPLAPVVADQQEIDPFEWKELVGKATEEIQDGKVEKIVLAREMQVRFKHDANIAPILKKLAETQTNSYTFAFENGEDCFLGATPERLVKVEDRQLLSTCLAGTASRGDTEEQDKRIGNKLLNDRKNLEEHGYVVKMIKEAVAACSKNVKVPGQPVLYPLKHLQHLYTPVEATLREGYTIIDVVKRLHPTPALGGMPREDSLAFIRRFENLDRGWYGAPFGWFDVYQNGEFAVAIRSALVQKRKASLFAGCGVVKESIPEEEYQETVIKFTPMLSALGGEE